MVYSSTLPIKSVKNNKFASTKEQIMKLLITLSVLLLTLTAYTQNTLFKVITSQGTAEVITNGKSTAIYSGARLNGGSKLKLSPNAYLGLIHITGNTIEVKQAGEYDITELAKQFTTEQSSYSKKYGDYVVQQVTSDSEAKKNYSYTGAVTRGAHDIVLWSPSEVVAVKLMQSIPIKLNWGKVDGVTEYKIIIKPLDESSVLYSEVTTETNVVLDLSSIPPTTDTPYFLEIVAIGAQATPTRKPFYLTDEKSSESITTELDDLKNHVDLSSAFGNLMVASFYAKHGLSMYAISSYQDAVDLEPEVNDYKNIRDIYFTEHKIIFLE